MLIPARYVKLKLWTGAPLALTLGSIAQILCIMSLQLTLPPILRCIVFTCSALAATASSLCLITALADQFEVLKTRCSSRLAGQNPPEEMKGNNHFTELDTILSQAQREWVTLIQRDYSLFENLAVEAERKRVTDDINKMIMPHLSHIATLAGAYENRVLATEICERLQIVESGVNGILTEVHPHLLAEAGLVSSIGTLVDRFKRASRIETTMTSDLSGDQINISLDAKFAIYRVTQEALNNIEKHSCATRARVSLRQLDSELVVLIEDNGRGFQERRSTQSRGLKNIKERAAGIGARVTWEKSQEFEKGTLVCIALKIGGSPDNGELLQHERTQMQLPANNTCATSVRVIPGS